MRVSEIREGSNRRLLVEGTLSGDWVDVLEECWLEAQATPNGGPIHVDLSEVTWIDDKGRGMLARMAQDGAVMRATGVMNRAIIAEIIEEILAGDASPEP